VISVIIPTCNYAHFITQAIDSVLKQYFKDVEIIVVDDGSTDNTKEMLEPYKKSINYFYKENGGLSSTRNYGIAQANGEYIAFLDADDIYLPNFLNACFAELVKHNYDLVMTDNFADFYNNDGNFLRREIQRKEHYLGNEQNLYYVIFNSLNMALPAQMVFVMKKKAFEQVGYFDEQLTYLEDWDLWLRIADQNLKISYVQKPLFIYRRHKDSLCRNPEMLTNRLRNIYSAFEKNRNFAFQKDQSLKKVYSERLWSVGVQAITEKLGFLFGLKCLFKSQIHYFNLRQLLNSMRFVLKERLLRRLLDH